MMAADLNAVPAAFLKDLAITAGFVIGVAAAAAGIYSVFRKRRIEPQPLEVKHPAPIEVRKGEQFVPNDLFKTVTARLDQRLESIEKSVADVRAERKDDVSDIYRTMNAVAREVSELKATTTMQNQQLSRMDEKLDKLMQKA